MKPRVRVKAVTLMLSPGIPADARPGDLIVGNRGAAALIVRPPSQFGGLCGCLTREYAGNYYEGARPAPGGRVYDFS